MTPLAKAARPLVGHVLLLRREAVQRLIAEARAEGRDTDADWMRRRLNEAERGNP